MERKIENLKSLSERMRNYDGSEVLHSCAIMEFVIQAMFSIGYTYLKTIVHKRLQMITKL